MLYYAMYRAEITQQPIQLTANVLSPIASGYREAYGVPIKEETCTDVQPRDRSTIRFIYSKRIFPFVDGIGRINFRILAETARTPGVPSVSWSPSRARVEEAEVEVEGRAPKERKNEKEKTRVEPGRLIILS